MKSSILIITYNRPKEFKKLFSAVKKFQDRKIFIFQDGKSNFDKKWEKQNLILKKIKNKKNIIIKFSKKKHGCKIGVTKAINWFFNHNKEGIILEDDCIPSKTFFMYCDELLEKYRYKDIIKLISGYNFYKNIYTRESYFFSKHVEVWGWATWSRVWKKFNLNMKNWKKSGNEVISERFKNNPNLSNYYFAAFNSTFQKKIDTWDHQFVYYVWKSKGLTISPSVNLVRNIGFNKNATHTKLKNIYLELRAKEMKFPIIHPKKVKENEYLTNKLDRYLERKIFNLQNKRQKLKDYVITILKKIRIK